MTVVTGSVAQAMKQAVDPRQHQRLERAAWAAQRAGEQASQLLDLAHRQSAEGGAVDLNLVVRRLKDTMLQLAGPGVLVVLNLAAVPVVAKLGTGQFERVLLALVRNAAEAMPQGGAVTVSTSAMGVPGDTATVQITVSDQGSGMPPEIAARATEAFFTTKGAHAATGLGLFLALGFAEQAGGKLSIESKPGCGTTVTLVLPSAADA
jgi:signal transduction histidine kinase